MARDQPDNNTNIMQDENNRRLSYRNWPVRFIDPNDLAQAGFYYTENEDNVRCAFCNIVLNRWEEGDSPIEDHKRYSVNCPFIRRRDCRNGPIAADRDICGRSARQIMPNSLPEQENFRLPEQDIPRLPQQEPSGLPRRSTSNLPSAAGYGIPHNGGPAYEKYTSLAERVKSYKNWPAEKKLRPEQLAAAGFFYQGVGDRTVCFYCRGGLNHWEDDDDEWEQHAKWFPNCSFVLMQKGSQFVSEVNNRLDDAGSNQAEAVSSEVPGGAETTSCIVQKLKKDDNKDCATCKACKICYMKEIEIAFVPCGHVAVCVDCALALTVCPFCRKPIKTTLKVFPL